ncbi:HdeA/HdeB family chaperone [Crocosphaera sp.]|uniref:HdeA/HdeB family chaperone n=1 Tax=Crocosphaera sp. TaxID=2729996 RepID=UPI003F257811|nr:HdeA/HdeB family chaperone [Crocosphaera sp.]
MNKRTISTMILFTLFGFGVSTTQVRAEKMFDVATITCKDLLLMEGDQRDSTLVFFHGVMLGRNNTTMLDTEKITNQTDQVLEMCIAKPASKLMSVFEETR